MQAGLSVFSAVRNAQGFRHGKGLLLCGLCDDHAPGRERIRGHKARKRLVHEPFAIGRIEKHDVEGLARKARKRVHRIAAEQARAVLRAQGLDVFLNHGASLAGNVAKHGALRAAGGWDTGVYPSFPTDAAPLMAAALLRAQGESRVTDTIFENRFACAEGFLRLGASVNVCGRTLHVHGMDLLNGADVEAPDLRGGAALVIAALQAQGSTRVMGAEHISRGYEDIAALLAPLGARITRSWG